MKDCLLILPITKTFPYSHKLLLFSENNFHLSWVGHAITVHSSQRSMLEYMKDDFDGTSKNGKPNTVLINQLAMYTILSRAKSRYKLQLMNFELEHIKVNTATLQKILKNVKGSIIFLAPPFIKNLLGNSTFYHTCDPRIPTYNISWVI